LGQLFPDLRPEYSSTVSSKGGTDFGVVFSLFSLDRWHMLGRFFPPKVGKLPLGALPPARLLRVGCKFVRRPPKLGEIAIE
jgi:hypothetical protein